MAVFFSEKEKKKNKIYKKRDTDNIKQSISLFL